MTAAQPYRFLFILQNTAVYRKKRGVAAWNVPHIFLSLTHQIGVKICGYAALHCTPHSLFGLAEKRTRRARCKRKGAYNPNLHSSASLGKRVL